MNHHLNDKDHNQFDLNDKDNDQFDLTEYLNTGVQNIVANVLKASLKNPKESAFLIKYLQASKQAEKRRSRQERLGRHIPPFLIASISMKCNLFCKGCYARANQSCHENSTSGQMSSEEWSRIFNEAEELGVSFILLAGGEPLMRKDVIQCAGEYQNIVFPIFTNGTMIDDDFITLFHHRRNLVPILSIEGSQAETDERRGSGVYRSIENAMDKLKSKGIFFGVSITITTKNIQTITQESFLRSLSEAGCKVVFFVEYVPVTPETDYLAPTQKERDWMDSQLSLLRTRSSEMTFLSFPGDEKHSGGCLAAGRGFFHINANGDAEPCPFSPFSDISVKDNSLLDVLNSKLFCKLTSSEFLSMEHTGGCVLFEKEEEVRNLLSCSQIKP